LGCEWVYNGIAVSHFGYIYISHGVVSWDIYKPILGYTISIHIMGYIMGIYIYISSIVVSCCIYTWSVSAMVILIRAMIKFFFGG
jgi:hypothetical protein